MSEPSEIDVEETIEVGPDGVRLKNLAQMRRWVRIAVASGAIRVSADRANAQESEVLLRLQAGLERGYPPTAALEQIHVINGRLCMGGDAMLAMVLRSGKVQVRERFEGQAPDAGAPVEFWTDDYRAVCTIKREDQTDEVVGSYSVGDAKRAKLWMKMGKDRQGKPRATPWVTNPARMLRYRALGFALRDAAADIVQGLITEEEARDYPAGAAPFNASDVRVPPDEPLTKPSDALAARLGQDEATEAPDPEDQEAQARAGEEPQASPPTEEDAPAEAPPADEPQAPANSRTSETAKGPPRTVEAMRYELGQMLKALAEHRRCEVPEVYSKAFRALFKGESKVIPLDGVTDEKALRRFWSSVANQCDRDAVKWPLAAKGTPA